MKNLPYYIIIALVILLFLTWFFRGNKSEVINITSKIDSAIKPHREYIIKIRAHDKAIMRKIKEDSTTRIIREVQYEKIIAALKNKLWKAKYTGNPSTVPDDSVKIAMQCLKEATLKDSILLVQANRIIELKAQIEELQADYSKILDDNQAEKNELQSIIDLKSTEVKELIDHLKKANRKAKVNLVKGLLIGGLSGAAGEAILK